MSDYLNSLFNNYKMQQRYTAYQKDKVNNSSDGLDVNGDKVVDEKDLKILKEQETNLLKQENLWDFNNDGKFNSYDIGEACLGVDLNNDGKIDNDEQSFINNYKPQIFTGKSKNEIANAETSAKARRGNITRESNTANINGNVITFADGTTMVMSDNASATINENGDVVLTHSGEYKNMFLMNGSALTNNWSNSITLKTAVSNWAVMEDFLSSNINFAPEMFGGLGTMYDSEPSIEYDIVKRWSFPRSRLLALTLQNRFWALSKIIVPTEAIKPAAETTPVQAEVTTQSTEETSAQAETTPVAEETPVVETPAQEETAPVAEETPAEETPAQEETAPVAEETPVVETPAQETTTPVAEETPVVETPTQEEVTTPVTEEIPAEETPAQAETTPVAEETPVEETPAQEETAPVAEETPVEETPAQEATTPVAEEIPAEETPTQEATTPVVEETPVEETPAQEATAPVAEETPTTQPTAQNSTSSAKPTISGNCITFSNGKTVNFEGTATVNDDGTVTVEKPSRNWWDNNSSTSIYNSQGVLTKEISNNNYGKVEKIYDETTGNLVKETSNTRLFGSTEKTYDAKTGNLVKEITNDDGDTTEKIYDANTGKITMEINSDRRLLGLSNESITKYFYDDKTGNITQTVATDANGKETKTEYDTSSGRPVTITVSTKFGDVISKTEKQYYDNGKIKSIVETGASGSITETLYNTDGKEISEIRTDKNGNKLSSTQIEYYSNGNKKSVSSESYSSGKLTSSTDTSYYESGNEKSVSEKRYSGGELVSSSDTEYYDTSSWRDKKSELEYSYDSTGKKTLTLKANYNESGTKTHYEEYYSDGSPKVVTEYDETTGKIKKMVEYDGYTTTVPASVARLVRDASGRIQLVTEDNEDAGKSKFVLNRTTETLYNADGKEISKISTDKNGDKLSSTQTAYYSNGNKKSVSSESYSSGKLTSSTDTAYYESGNEKSVSKKRYSGGELVSSSDTEYYDTSSYSDKKSEVEYSYDSNGKKTLTLKATYDENRQETHYESYDKSGNLTALREYDATSKKLLKSVNVDYIGIKTEVQYDARTGKIVSKVVTDKTGSSVSSKQYEYSYDASGSLNGGSISETNSDGSSIKSDYAVVNNQVTTFESSKTDANGKVLTFTYSSDDVDKKIVFNPIQYGRTDAQISALETAAENSFKEQALANPTIDRGKITFATGKSITIPDGASAVVNDDGSVSLTSSDGKTTRKFNKSGVLISTVNNPDSTNPSVKTKFGDGYTVGETSIIAGRGTITSTNSDGSLSVTSVSGITTTVNTDGTKTYTDKYGDSLDGSTLITSGSVGRLTGVIDSSATSFTQLVDSEELSRYTSSRYTILNNILALRLALLKQPV